MSARKHYVADGCMKCERAFTDTRPCCCAAATLPIFPRPGEKRWYVAGMCAECCDHRPHSHVQEFNAKARRAV